MPVRIVEEDEKLRHEYCGGIFYYRRALKREIDRWVRVCTNNKGRTNDTKLTQMALSYCLLGWEEGTVVDGKGNNLEFSEEVMESLPGEFYLEFADLIGLSQPEEKEEEIKNSTGTSS